MFFSFSLVANDILAGKIKCEDIDIVVANTACPNAEMLAEAYAYKGEGIKEIAQKLFPRMKQYRLAKSFHDYHIDNHGNPVFNVVAGLGKNYKNGDTFKDVFERILSHEASLANIEPTRKYWTQVFTECGLL